MRGPGRRHRYDAACGRVRTGWRVRSTRQRGVTRWDQARLIQINARRGWSAEAAIAPLTAVRDFPKLRSPRVTVAGTFLPTGAAASAPCRPRGLRPAALPRLLRGPGWASRRACSAACSAAANLRLSGVQPLAQRVGPGMEEHPLDAVGAAQCLQRSDMFPRWRHNGRARMARQLRTRAVPSPHCHRAPQRHAARVLGASRQPSRALRGGKKEPRQSSGAEFEGGESSRC